MYLLIYDGNLIVEEDSKAGVLFKYIDKKPVWEQGRYCVAEQKEGYLLKIERGEVRGDARSES